MGLAVPEASEPRAQPLVDLARQASHAVFVGIDPLPRAPGSMTLTPSSPTELSDWLKRNVTSYNDTVLIVLPNDLPDRDQYLQVCRRHEASAMISQHTLEEKWCDLGRQYVLNLPLLNRVGWTHQMGLPLLGQTAFVVGAGPSLEKNRHLLRQASEVGYVFAVNTSAGAVPKDTPIDAIFCAESLDVSSGMQKRAGETLHVLELAAHPSNWAVDSRAQVCVSTNDPSLLPYTMESGGIPIPFSAGVTSMAASQAFRWGAKRVVLVGQDLAWGDGACYASGSPFEDMRGERGQDDVSRFSGDSKVIQDSEAYEVPAWSGGTTVTTAMWAGYIQNWAGIAERYPIVNCTEGGAHIPNAREMTLRNFLDRTTSHVGPKVDLAERAMQHRGTPRRALERIERESRAIVEAQNSFELAQAIQRCPIAALWYYPEVSRMEARGGLTARERGEAVNSMRRRAGEALLEIVTGALAELEAAE